MDDKLLIIERLKLIKPIDTDVKWQHLFDMLEEWRIDIEIADWIGSFYSEVPVPSLACLNDDNELFIQWNRDNKQKIYTLSIESIDKMDYDFIEDGVTVNFIWIY